MQRLRPQTDGHARTFPPATPGALLGGSTADAHGVEPGQAAGRIQARCAPPAAINDNAHARHGQRGLGDRGGQHHPPPLRRAQGAVLLRRRQITMQRQHQRATAGQRLLGAADLAHARQEGENIALMRGQGVTNGAGHGVRQVAQLGDVAGGVNGGDGEHPPGTLDGLGLQQRAEPRPICRGGHREQAQLGAILALQIEAESQGQIGIDGAFMDLIEDHAGRVLQAGIGQQAANQQPLRHHLDAGGGGDGTVQPGAVADTFTDRLPDQARHAGGGGAGGEAAGFEHDDLAPLPPRRVAQRQRHQRGLAGAGRCDQNGVGPRRKSFEQGGQTVTDGQIG